MLITRREKVLRALVDQYVSTAAPVPSEGIVNSITPKASPATIRNDMAELEEEGYITRPHVSAGGIPSSKGYRLYVDTMEGNPDPPFVMKRRITEEFSKAGVDVETWVHLAASLLSHMTHNMALVTSPRATHSKMRRMELVYLQDFLALMVIILQEARLRQQLVSLSEPTSQDQLTKVANKLNHLFVGLSHQEIEAQQTELSPLETEFKQSAITVLKERDRHDWSEHHIDGLRRLLAQPEFSESTKAREVAEVIEEQVLVRNILEKAPQQGQVQLIIGEENPEEALQEFSIILCQYGSVGQASGTISVIGPTRMGYPVSVGSIRFLSSFMTALISGFYEWS